MLVIVKSAPDTKEGQRGVKLARDMGADLVLLQNAVYFAEKERLEGFCGSVYVLEEESRLRGAAMVEKGVKMIGYDEFIGLMAENDKVTGAF